MRIAIVGAGAIGGFLAGALSRAGVATGIVARGEHLAAIRRNGLRVESDLGSFTARVAASDRLADLGTFDTLLLTFKAHQWAPLLPQLAPYAKTGITIVTLQNGLPFWYVSGPALDSVDPEARIAAALSGANVVGGVVHVSGSVPEPGFVRQSGGLRYVMGDPDGRANPALDALSDTMRASALDPVIDADVRAPVWLKLVNNVGLNTVSALRRMTIRPLLRNPDARNEVRTLMDEALHVGRALGVVDRVDIDARIEYAARLDDVKTSMLQDLERRRPLELDPILGAVIELADRHDVAVPRIRASFEALRHAELEARSQ